MGERASRDGAAAGAALSVLSAPRQPRRRAPAAPWCCHPSARGIDDDEATCPDDRDHDGRGCEPGRARAAAGAASGGRSPRSTSAPAACRRSTATSRSTGTSAPARCSSRSRASTPSSCSPPASSAGLGSNDIGLDRGSGGGARIVSFQRVGPRVLLVQPNQSFRSSSANPLERKSVEDSFAKSVLWGFAVAAETRRPRAGRRHRLPPARRHTAPAASLRPGTYRVDRTRSAFYLPRHQGVSRRTPKSR